MISLHASWIFFSTQGEKGEPGSVIGADGSLLSTLAGPAGPKGVKVVSDFIFCFFYQNKHLNSRPLMVHRVTSAPLDLLELRSVAAVREQWERSVGGAGHAIAVGIFFPTGAGGTSRAQRRAGFSWTSGKYDALDSRSGFRVAPGC